MKIRLPAIIRFLILTGTPLFGESIPLVIRHGRPMVEGVYINGQGPYRFLLDTGSQTNVLEPRLAQAIGLEAKSGVKVVTPAGAAPAHLVREVNIRLGSAQASKQELLLIPLEYAAQEVGPIQGILGQEFLSRFDYLLALRRRTIEFGKQERSGLRVEFDASDGRPAIKTSLGKLVLDSGVNRLVLFDLEPDRHGSPLFMKTTCGLLTAGTASGRRLVIGSRVILRRTTAVAVPHSADSSVDGLLPTNLFQAIYVSNSEGYVVFE